MTRVLGAPAAPRIRIAPKKGYVGLDIGTRALKVAVIERWKSGFSLASARAVTHTSPLTFGEPGRCVETIAESLDRVWESTGSWLGDEAACVLPCSAMTILSLCIPDGSPDELRAIIGGEFAEETGISPEQWSLTWWNDCLGDGSGDGKPLTAAGVPHDLSDRLLEVLLSRGLACRLMVSPPQVLAQCTAPVTGTDSASNVAVLDWGFESAVLTVASGGRPIFTRILRHCGLDRVIDAVANRLELSPADVPLLICQDESIDGDSSVIDQDLGPIDALIDGALERLRDELARTLNHLRRHAPAATPQQLLLCGGGGTLRGIESRLSDWTRLSTSVWNGPCFGKGLGRLAPAPCVTAAASVLSSMRWTP